jgi:hypothetical protein
MVVLLVPLNRTTLFAWLISHQPAVLFSQNKSATSNQPTVFFSQNKPAPAVSHQPNEQAVADPDSLFASSKRAYLLAASVLAEHQPR